MSKKYDTKDIIEFLTENPLPSGPDIRKAFPGCDDWDGTFVGDMLNAASFIHLAGSRVPDEPEIELVPGHLGWAITLKGARVAGYVDSDGDLCATDDDTYYLAHELKEWHQLWPLPENNEPDIWHSWASVPEGVAVKSATHANAFRKDRDGQVRMAWRPEVRESWIGATQRAGDLDGYAPWKRVTGPVSEDRSLATWKDWEDVPDRIAAKSTVNDLFYRKADGEIQMRANMNAGNWNKATCQTAYDMRPYAPFVQAVGGN